MAGLKHILQWVWEGRSWSNLPRGSEMAAALGFSTASGIAVTPDSAMQLSAVSACVRLIAESIASLPLHVYRRDGDKRIRITEGPHHELLHDQPNQMMTSFGLRETLAAQVLTRGNAYALILWNGAGEPVELLPLPHAKPCKQANGRLAYTFTLDGKSYVEVDQAYMLHIPGLAWDGVCGMSPIQYAAQSIGLGLAAEQFGATFYGNGARPSLVMSVPGALSKEQVTTLRSAWQESFGGVANGNKTAVVFNGATVTPMSIQPDEAQFIETRKFQVSEIARWYRVPPHMIGDLDKATFSNIEHQALEFVTHTLRPWLVRFEQELKRKLFIGIYAEQYAEFNVDGLLRGDIKSRSDYYIRGRQWGWLSANDIRRLENMEPIDNGDVYLSPLNMVNAGTEAAAANANQDNAP